MEGWAVSGPDRYHPTVPTPLGRGEGGTGFPTGSVGVVTQGSYPRVKRLTRSNIL